MKEYQPGPGAFAYAASGLIAFVRRVLVGIVVVLAAPFLLIMFGVRAVARTLSGGRASRGGGRGGFSRFAGGTGGDPQPWWETLIGWLQGWRGRVRPRGPGIDIEGIPNPGEHPPPAAQPRPKLGLRARLLELLRRLLLRRREPDIAGGKPYDPLPPRPPGVGGDGAPGASGSIPGPKREPVEEYIESLRRGGHVELGGAFLILPFMHARDVESTLIAAFGRHGGNGLLHVMLDELLRAAVGVRKRRAPRPERLARPGSLRFLKRVSRPRRKRRPPLDPRFDVVLSRRGPAPIEHDDDENRGRQRPSAGMQGDFGVPRLAADNPVLASTATLAQQARAWLAQRLPEPMSSARRERLVRSLLRQSTHVRLEDDDTIHVRFARPRRASTARELEHLLAALNAPPAHTIGWMSYPVAFATTSGRRGEP